MGRPKGSVNKRKPTLSDIKEGRGNPDFNINDAQSVDPSWKDVAPAAITAEDLALDRELEKLARDQEHVDISDKEPVPMKKAIEPYTLLSSVMEVEPAKNITELDEQVFDAKQSDCDSIEATPGLVRYFCKREYPDKVGYFVYHDIKVYIAGFFDQSVKKDKLTIEQRNFPTGVA